MFDIWNLRFQNFLCNLNQLGSGISPRLHPRGCPACRGTGYSGRRAIAELLVPNRAIDRLIFEGADDAAIERVAVEQGMRPIFDNGLLAFIEGDTTIEEVVRCIRSEA